MTIWDQRPESAHDMITDEKRREAIRNTGGHPYVSPRSPRLQYVFWLVMIMGALLLAAAALRAWDHDLAHDYARPDVESRMKALIAGDK